MNEKRKKRESERDSSLIPGSTLLRPEEIGPHHDGNIVGPHFGLILVL